MGKIMIFEKEIRDFDGNILTKEDMILKLKDYLLKDYYICVGSDSQMYFENTVMVTAVVVINRLKGNNCFYVKQEIDNLVYPSLRSRIFDEAFKSIEAAINIKEHLDCNIEIHLDIGDNMERNATARFVKELTGMVTGQGFSVEIKPRSFASSGFADCFTKELLYSD